METNQITREKLREHGFMPVGILEFTAFPEADIYEHGLPDGSLIRVSFLYPDNWFASHAKVSERDEDVVKVHNMMDVKVYVHSRIKSDN